MRTVRDGRCIIDEKRFRLAFAAAEKIQRPVLQKFRRVFASFGLAVLVQMSSAENALPVKTAFARMRIRCIGFGGGRDFLVLIALGTRRAEMPLADDRRDVSGFFHLRGNSGMRLKIELIWNARLAENAPEPGAEIILSCQHF